MIAGKSKRQNFLVNPIDVFVLTSSSPISAWNDYFTNLYEYINSNIPNIIGGDFNTVEILLIDTHLPKFNTIKSKEFNHLCLIIGLLILLEPSTTKEKCAWRGPTSASRSYRLFLTFIIFILQK